MINCEKIDYKQLTLMDINQLDSITKNKIDNFFQNIHSDEESVISKTKLENIGSIIKACKKIEKLRQKKKNKKLQKEVTYVMNAIINAAARVEVPPKEQTGSLATGLAKLRQKMEEHMIERRKKTKLSELNEKIQQLTVEATRKSIEGDFERAGESYFEAAGVAKEVVVITDNHDDHQRYKFLISNARSEFVAALEKERKIKPEICIKIAKCSEILGEYSDAANRYYQAHTNETDKIARLDNLIKAIECEQKIKGSGRILLARIDEVYEQVKHIHSEEIKQYRTRMFRIVSDVIQKNASENNTYPKAELFYDRMIAIADRFGAGRETKVEIVRILRKLSYEKERDNLRQAGDASYIAARYADLEVNNRNKSNSIREICLIAAAKQYFKANEIHMSSIAIDELVEVRKIRGADFKTDDIVRATIENADYKEIELLVDRLANIRPVLAFEIQCEFYKVKEGYVPSKEIASVKPTNMTIKTDIDRLRKEYHRWIDQDNKTIAHELIQNELGLFCRALGLKINLKMIEIETIREGDIAHEDGISETIGKLQIRNNLPPKIIIYGRFRGREDRKITILHEYLHGIAYLSKPTVAYKQEFDFVIDGMTTGRKVWLDEGLVEFFAQGLGKMAGIGVGEVVYYYETNFISMLSSVFNNDRILADALTTRDLTPVKKEFDRAFGLKNNDTTFYEVIIAGNAIDAIAIMRSRGLC